MSFLAPAAFALALLLPVVVALYLLKLRRTEQVVSSVYLWRRLVRDVQANAPWQRLRRNLLLLLQLLFLAALILALARPFTRAEGAGGQALILVLDTSASMGATDVAPSRLAAAKQEARRLVDGLPGEARVTVVAAGQGARLLVASSQDRRQIYQALDQARVGAGGSDLTAALELASAVAARQPETEIVVLSDGRVTLPARLAVEGRLRYVPLGHSGDNQAIAALSLRPAPDGASLSAFVQVANYGPALALRRLTLHADGQLTHAYDLEIEPGAQQAVVAEGLPPGTAALEARLEGADALPLDNRAWAVHRPSSPVAVTLVTEGNLFLETGLALLPGLEVTTLLPRDWRAGNPPEGQEEGATSQPALTILDAYLPITGTLPPGNLLFIAPPRSTGYFSVTGRVGQPAPRPASDDAPLLDNVDLSAVQVLDAVRLPLPAWGRPVVVGDLPAGETSGDAFSTEAVPLLFAGEVDGRRLAVLAFDLHRSDLPLQVAFPLLLSNLLDWLAPGGDGGLPAGVTPGAAVSFSLPPGAEAAHLVRPDGSSLRLVPQGGLVVFADTGQLGLYQLDWPAGDGRDRAAFAINLFSPGESDVAPASTLPLSAGGEAGEAGLSGARREWWPLLAWLALALLLVEWLVYHRGTVAHLWARLAGRGASGGADRSTRPTFHPSLFPFLPGLSFLHPGALWLLLLLPLVLALGLLGRRGRRATLRFWAGLALRLLLFLGLILALAGAQLRLRADTLTTVFVLDASDSVPPAERARGEALVRQAVGAMPAGDRAAVVLFGHDALVERLPAPERDLPSFASVPVSTRTDVAGALQLALALLPEEGARRIVLLSDGRENLGQALAQAELAAAHDVGLAYVPLGGPQGEVEVRVEALDAPADVRQGEDFDLVVVVHSSARTGATLRVLADGRLIHTQAIRLQEGLNRFRVPVEADAADASSGDEQASAGAAFRRFRAQVVPDADTRLQNNQASAFTVVHGPPRVLVVGGQAGEADNLIAGLGAAGMEVSRLSPGELPTTLAELAAFDGVVLANVPASALPPGAMEVLQAYVRDLGRGLLVSGGEDAFGAGGYQRTVLEETLPVRMEVRTKEQTPNLALVLAVDKSGSMGRCHCDNPDLNQTYTRREVGQPKVDIAKEAVMRAAGALGPLDTLGVVAFDQDARWAMEMSHVTDFAALEQAIGPIQALGQTNLRAGVEQAYAALQNTEARLKHVILLTDGWVHTGDLSTLAAEMQAQGITLSVVAAGGGAAEYLAGLAEQGGGRFYPAEDILRVPDFFLKETIQAVGRYIVEEPFFPLPSSPSPVLRQLDAAALPLLLGYNGTTPKGTARVILSTPRGDPLLATWQYGLGRAAVWTSDLKGQWAVEWLAWEGFPRFAAQLVGWTLPAPQVEGVSARVTLEGDQAVVRVEAVDEAGQPRNFLDASAVLVGPDLATLQADLEQVAAGRYEARVDLAQPGTYLLRLGIGDGGELLGQQTLGLVVPYSPEYRAGGADRALLAELARPSGGGELSDPAAAFLHNLPLVSQGREIWAPLLLLVALLFPLDVALRRLTLGRADLARAAAWLRGRLPARTRGAGREPVLGQLFQARDRARARHRRGEAPAEPAPRQPEPPSDAPPAESSPPAPAGDTPSTSGPEDLLARLREAKKRAGQDR